MTLSLAVPDHLQRNSSRVAADGYEETGLVLIEAATARAGLKTLAGSDVLDVGCGVRFAQTIVNRGLAVKSYVGVEVHRPIVDFMKTELEPFDARFRFVHWDVHHGLFHPEGARCLGEEPELPVEGSFDLVWFFSVFTHLGAADARALLRLARRKVRPTGGLLFTAFVDADLEGTESRAEGHPLQMVFYGGRTIEALLRETGWMLRGYYPGGEKAFLQPCFVCAPGLT